MYQCCQCLTQGFSHCVTYWKIYKSNSVSVNSPGNRMWSLLSFSLVSIIFLITALILRPYQGSYWGCWFVVGYELWIRGALAVGVRVILRFDYVCCCEVFVVVPLLFTLVTAWGHFSPFLSTGIWTHLWLCCQKSDAFSVCLVVFVF